MVVVLIGVVVFVGVVMVLLERGLWIGFTGRITPNHYSYSRFNTLAIPLS